MVDTNSLRAVRLRAATALRLCISCNVCPHGIDRPAGKELQCKNQLLGRARSTVRQGLIMGSLGSVLTSAEKAQLDVWANAILLGIAALIAYPFLQLLMAMRYQGRWRVMALLPIVATGPAAVYMIFQLWQKSDQWVLASTTVMPLAVLYLVIVALAHRLAHRPEPR
jgi:hypothetical protein